MKLLFLFSKTFLFHLILISLVNMFYLFLFLTLPFLRSLILNLLVPSDSTFFNAVEHEAIPSTTTAPSSGAYSSSNRSSDVLPTSQNKRQTKTPAHLDQYHCYLLNKTHFPSHPIHTMSYPISAFLSYDNISDHHKQFLLNITTSFAPKTFHEVFLSGEFKVR